MVDLALSIVADQTPKASELLGYLKDQLVLTVPEDAADVVVALGGDGFMLETLRRHLGSACAVYGINCGTVGFLLNEWHTHAGNPGDLVQRIATADRVHLSPLKVQVTTIGQKNYTGYAINEVSLLRERHQAAKIQVLVDGVVRIDELIGDGVLVATPAGSTAYNLSVRGPVLPLRSQLLALTPISPFRPRRWQGALLPNTAKVEFKIMEPVKRPVSAVMDDQEIRDVISVTAEEDPQSSVCVLFDPEHRLDERILKEQFAF
jgi:NAD+ kinase